MDETPTLDEQLTRLEAEIEQLRREFDVYAGGGAPRPPAERKSRVESFARALAGAPGIGALEGFRYNCAVANLAAFDELWRHNVQGAAGAAADSLPQHSAGPKIQVDSQKGFTHRVVRCSAVRADPERFRELYGCFMLAKRSSGEPLGDLPFARFEQMVAAQIGQIRGKTRCKAVDFTVEIVGGSVKLKATAS